MKIKTTKNDDIKITLSYREYDLIRDMIFNGALHTIETKSNFYDDVDMYNWLTERHETAFKIHDDMPMAYELFK